ncbi:Monoamine oxidase [Alkalibacterium subtropicum]|uniref:Monoamine oxidase n=1 Tax=Alkalibacterium subtropicum TaxID=753702 RepID=A0A1I1FJK2_9LACT|nr:NAD(P)/FAD-dependent oxidoreductase [Alkalibacterium subtropicum]SFB99484.1 Monoamine oxidase [Alkalibacterium subtropicum]
MMENQTSEYDVIIVGAGLAGLAAAKAMHEEGKSYVVLEATDRSGGKVCSKVSEDSSRYFELGAQFVSEEMTEMVKLIKEAGMVLTRTEGTQDNRVISDKSKEPIYLDFHDITDTLGAISGEHFSSKPMDQVLEKHISQKRKRQILKSFIAAETTVNSRYINAEAIKNLISRVTTTTSGLDHQASGPLSNVVKHLESLNKDAIHYLEPVVKVKETKSGYTVKTKNKSKYHGKALIMAVPPTAAARITFSSALADHYRPYLDSYTDGAVIKMTFVYDKPFWRESAVKGKQKSIYGVVYSAHEGVNLMDSSIKGGENRLTLYIGGEKAIELADVPTEVKEFYARERLIEVLGEDAENYKDYEISEWQQSPYYGGGYGAIIHHHGLPDANEILREPYHTMVFASTELATDFPLFMEGAVLSGQYAAKRLIESMSESVTE